MKTIYKQRVYTSIAARGGGGSFKRLRIYNSEEHVPIEFVCVCVATVLQTVSIF